LLFRPGSSGTVCTVHERHDHSPDPMDRAEDMTFVRDGFSWPVAIAAPIVLLARGAWLPLLAYLCAAVVMVSLISAVGLSPEWATLALLALNVIAAFEAPALERWLLQRRGWDEVGVVSGLDQADCERRFFDTWLRSQTGPSAAAVAAAASPVSAIRRLFSTS
jgi:hypothetical protein